MVRVRAYAKINLHLRIRARRPDGYHEIDSVMHRISWRDDLELRWRSDGEIHLVVEPAGAAPSVPRAAGPWAPGGAGVYPAAAVVPAGPDNLAWRAARLLQQACGVRAGVDIRLTKRVAAGAGLGGGSADAAAVLRGLRRLWGVAVDGATLRRLGEDLGADIPFLLGGRAARVRGKGEQIEPLPPWPGLPLVLVPLPRAVATAWAYAEWDRRQEAGMVEGPGGAGAGEPRDTPADDGVAEAVARRDLETLARLAWNDFEPVVAAAIPEVAAVIETLRREGAVVARMSGSGPVVWGIFPPGEAARQAWRRLQAAHPAARLARTL